MQHRTSPLSAEAWLLDLFSSVSARKGNIVRRKRRDIERVVGLDRFARELERRGYRAVENAGQIVIFCNNEPVVPFAVPLSLKESGPETLEVSGFRNQTDAR